MAAILKKLPYWNLYLYIFQQADFDTGYVNLNVLKYDSFRYFSRPP